MLTIKLPYTTSSDGRDAVDALIRKYSPVLRYSYNRFVDDMGEKEQRDDIKDKFKNTDSWFTQSTIKCAAAMHEKDYADPVNPLKRIFGGNAAFKKRSAGKLSYVDFDLIRNAYVEVVGEAPQKGNRKFELDIANNRILFKINRSTHVYLYLPKLHRKMKERLVKLEQLMKSKQMPVMFRVFRGDINIIYDEVKLNGEPVYTPNEKRYAGIDLNPNWIGLTIFDDGNVFRSYLFDLRKLTINSGKASAHSDSIYLTDKLDHEVKQVMGWIADICRHHKVKCLTIEDLNIKAKNHKKGKNFNRLVNNKWPRRPIATLLEKYCKLIGIKLFKVGAWYSSYIGNINYPQLPDACASAAEMARRGHDLVVQKVGQLYPKELPSISDLQNRWKEDVNWNSATNWKELCNLIKNSEVRYRVPHPSVGFEAFENKRSRVQYLCLKFAT